MIKATLSMPIFYEGDEIPEPSIWKLPVIIEKKKVKLTTECFVLEKKVLEGSAEILVSSKSDL